MILSIIGNLGSGKTLFATYIAIKELENGKSVFANYKINYKTQDGRSVKKIDVGKLVQALNDNKMHFELNNALLILDEAYLYMDSRTSANTFQRYLGYFVLQSRKLGFDIISVEQLSSSIDKRLRGLTDIWILAQKQLMEKEDNINSIFDEFSYIESENEEDLNNIAEEQFTYTFISADQNEILGSVYLSLDKAKQIFPYYQTQEIAKGSILMNQAEKKNVMRLINSIKSGEDNI